MARDMLNNYSVNVNITKEVIKEEQMMSGKAKTPSGRICETCEYRWEDPYRKYCLYGLVNSTLEYWRWE